MAFLIVEDDFDLATGLSKSLQYEAAVLVVANKRRDALLASALGPQLVLVADIGRTSLYVRRDVP